METRLHIVTTQKYLAFYKPGLVSHSPCVQVLPKLGNNGFINVTSIGIDLWATTLSRQSGASKVPSRVPLVQ
jgi:hypothetical protein